MKLAVINLTGGHFSGGYKKYLENMLPRLAGHSCVDALLCASPEGNDIPAWFTDPLDIDFCICKRLALRHIVRFPDMKLIERLRRFSPDIIFMPIERYMKFDEVPVVNMVRNMEPFLPSMKGDPFQEALRKSIQRRLVRSSIKRADHTIAVSGFVKDYLTTSLRVPENKISQVHHGLAPRANGFSRRPALIPAGWDRGFLFTCGSIRPARGLEDAFEALLDLKTRNRDMRLVIAGGTSPGMTKYHEGLVRFLAARGLADRVCWAGTLSDEEMCWCYKRCFLFIMTSRVEACPNIALEALSSGAISIAANNPPLPEVFVDCASFYETGNGRSLAEAIIGRLSLSDRERRSLSERARERSMMFSWDTTADKTLEVLRRVLKRSKNSE